MKEERQAWSDFIFTLEKIQLSSSHDTSCTVLCMRSLCLISIACRKSLFFKSCLLQMCQGKDNFGFSNHMQKASPVLKLYFAWCFQTTLHRNHSFKLKYILNQSVSQEDSLKILRICTKYDFFLLMGMLNAIWKECTCKDFANIRPIFKENILKGDDRNIKFDSTKYLDTMPLAPSSRTFIGALNAGLRWIQQNKLFFFKINIHLVVLI